MFFLFLLIGLSEQVVVVNLYTGLYATDNKTNHYVSSTTPYEWRYEDAILYTEDAEHFLDIDYNRRGLLPFIVLTKTSDTIAKQRRTWKRREPCLETKNFGAVPYVLVLINDKIDMSVGGRINHDTTQRVRLVFREDKESMVYSTLKLRFGIMNEMVESLNSKRAIVLQKVEEMNHLVSNFIKDINDLKKRTVEQVEMKISTLKRREAGIQKQMRVLNSSSSVRNSITENNIRNTSFIEEVAEQLKKEEDFVQTKITKLKQSIKDLINLKRLSPECMYDWVVIATCILYGIYSVDVTVRVYDRVSRTRRLVLNSPDHLMDELNISQDHRPSVSGKLELKQF